ncbi:MAG TPA: hypothetical protein VFQ51_10860 [Vicinamibacteria bacterium]|nr:hypothetical protein [Vicinamibacteria bacterium]
MGSARSTLRPLVAFVATAAGAQPPSASPADDRVREQFLQQAEVVSVQSAGIGSLRALLRRGGLLHDAGIQAVDESVPTGDPPTVIEADVRGSYKHDVAAYRLDRLLGLGMVPVTILRDHGRKPAAFAWSVDDMLMTERERYVARARPPDVASWNRQLAEVALFDQLISNLDRSAGNLIIDRGWQVWLTGHSRAFRSSRSLQNPKALGDSCERRLLGALRTLAAPSVKAEMRDVLDEAQVDGLLARRDQIVAYYERMIADRGQAAVLYDLPPRGGGDR